MDTPIDTEESIEYIVTTIARSTSGYNDDVGTSAQFDYPRGVAIDKNGDIIVADTDNHRIRKIEIKKLSN